MIPKASLSVIFNRSEKYLHSCGVHPNVTKIGLEYMLVFLLEHCGETSMVGEHLGLAFESLIHML